MARQNRMDRSQFYQLMAGKGEADLKKVLWELYWRGKAEVRERIEGILEPESASHKAAEASSLDGDRVLHDIKDFAALVRSGAYMGGTREVSRQERSKWRVTFRSHVENASGLLKQGDLGNGLPAMERLVDLLCEMGYYDYVHSEDPVQASGIVVSDRVELLWRTVLERDGFQAFVRLAPAQLIRWESPYGWTRTGATRLCAKERTLAEVLQAMLKGPDAWLRFADAYLEALDRIPRKAQERSRSWSSGWDSECEKRSGNLADWHECLRDQLRFGEGGDRLFRIASHPSLAGPEADYFLARLCFENGQADRAKDLMLKCLKRLPGHQDFQSFAKELGLPLPQRA